MFETVLVENAIAGPGKDYYFAYGHNTNKEQFYKRIPKAQLIGKANLNHYKFSLEQYSDIKPNGSSHVEGVLWKIPKDSEPQLNKYEQFYERIPVIVSCSGKKYKAYAYKIKGEHYGKNPSQDYIDYVRKGYKENDLPESQLDKAVKEKLG